MQSIFLEVRKAPSRYAIVYALRAARLQLLIILDRFPMRAAILYTEAYLARQFKPRVARVKAPKKMCQDSDTVHLAAGKRWTAIPRFELQELLVFVKYQSNILPSTRSYSQIVSSSLWHFLYRVDFQYSLFSCALFHKARLATVEPHWVSQSEERQWSLRRVAKLFWY